MEIGHELSEHELFPPGGGEEKLFAGGGSALHHAADAEREHRLS